MSSVLELEVISFRSMLRELRSDWEVYKVKGGEGESVSMSSTDGGWRHVLRRSKRKASEVHRRF
jgi:hypothetical protein